MTSPPKEKPRAGEQTGQIKLTKRGTPYNRLCKRGLNHLVRLSEVVA